MMNEYLSLFVFMIGEPVSGDRRILTDEVSTTNELVLDSGCSQHMFNSCRNLTNFIAYAPNQKCVTVANGTSVPVAGYGQLGILEREYFVPLLSHNLLSVNALTEEGIVIFFSEDQAILHKASSLFNFEAMRTFKSEGLYRIGLHQIEMCTRIPHVHCLAHPQF